MLHITDNVIKDVVSPEDAWKTLQQAYLQFGNDEVAVQSRIRTQCEGIKLSTLGAVLPKQKFLGAKVYTTIKGKFSFVILLFSAESGELIATLDAGALTQIRTAACSVIAAQIAMPTPPRVMGLFGLGTQGREHAFQMARAFPLEQLLIANSHQNTRTDKKQLSSQLGVPVDYAAPSVVASSSDLIVTATRSEKPLFSGNLLKDNAFIAAIGSSLPTTRELDNEAITRAQKVIVEWKSQSLVEAGDILLSEDSTNILEKIIELPNIIGRPNKYTFNGITIYKAVGIGLADISIAGLAYSKIMAR